jgi:hypothetical protein
MGGSTIRVVPSYAEHQEYCATRGDVGVTGDFQAAQGLLSGVVVTRS